MPHQRQHGETKGCLQTLYRFRMQPLLQTAPWPLMIDPQLQGVTWIKSREAENDMKTLTQSGKFLDAVERAISMGNPLLIENLPETIDAVMEPVLARSTVKRGGMVFIKIGDKDDVEYDP